MNNLTVPEILRSIRADEKAIPIFLFRHIEDPGRLTHGFRMSKKPYVEVRVQTPPDNNETDDFESDDEFNF
jgi:hypothetical protein